MHHAKAAAWLASTSLLALATGARADQAAQEPSAQVQEVIVTATRRSANLQDVPIAVQAISGQQLEKAGVKNPSDLQFIAPSVQVSASGGSGFAVRGVGTSSFNKATEQTVGLSVDGVVYGFVDDIGADLSDVEQVEVLKGPQGTQFGKNASGGLISVTTRKPSTAGYRFDARASWGEHNDTNDSVSANLPLGQSLAAILSAAYQSRDGIGYNAVLDKKVGKQEQWSVKGKLLWTPTEALSVYTLIDYHFGHWTPNFLSTYRYLGQGAGGNPPGLGVLDYGVVPGPDNTVSADPVNSFRHTGSGGVSTQVDYKLGDYTLTAISAYRVLNRKVYASIGGTPVEFANGPVSEQGNQISQELRLTSPSGGRLEYVGGLYYYRRGAREKSLFAGPFGGAAEAIFGPGAAISFAGGQNYATYRVESLAGFVDGKLKLTDSLNLIGGARIGHDRSYGEEHTKAIPGVFSFAGAPDAPSEGSVKDTNYAYRLGLQYVVGRSLNAYGTVARGYKGPIALPVAGSDVRQVQAEIVKSVELGLKSSFWDRRATANLSLFRQTFSNFQTSTLDNSIVPPGFVLGNAGGLKTQGAEVETILRPVSGLHLSAAVTYLDAHFTDFITNCYSDFEPIPLGTTTDPSGRGGCYTPAGSTIGFTQAAGAPLNNASKWNLSLQAAWTRELSGGLALDANANWLYRTKFFTNGADPNTRIDGYGVLGANVGVGSADGKWRIGLFARNLLDKYYVSAVETGIFDTGALTNVLNPEARRTIGVMLEAHY